MKLFSIRNILFIISLIILIIPISSEAHIKWFVEFDISDPPKSFMKIKSESYYLYLLLLSLFGVMVAILIDTIWQRRWGKFTLFEKIFSYNKNIEVNIIRIGTGVFFLVIWLVGDIILTPELFSEFQYIPYIQLLIAFSVLFKRSLPLAGLGIITLYCTAIYEYGLFHLLDYTLLMGLAFYLLTSSIKSKYLKNYRLPILYYSLVFSFLYSAIEKIAYPQWFYGFLRKNEFLMMGLDIDFYITSMAFVEFTLFFLLIFCRNGTILLAILINILIISGNIYFGKIDAIGHFPTNFILLILIIKGSINIENHDIRQPYYLLNQSIYGVIIYLIVLLGVFGIYYGIHDIMY
jgi:hypothetical protein